METTELIRYRRALKRKNYSAHTLKSYMSILKHFMRGLTVPLLEVTRKEIGLYVDDLIRKRRRPKTITCHLQTIRLFFDYLINEEGRAYDFGREISFYQGSDGGENWSEGNRLDEAILLRFHPGNIICASSRNPRLLR
jgi:site-specific recombinase XerD